MGPLASTSHLAGEADRARVAYLVYRVERRLRGRIDEAVRAGGVTTTEYVTLSVLQRHDGMSCAQLARWAFVSPQAMNVVVAGLEERGLVVRRPDPQHGRVRRTSVTRRGTEVLEGCERAMDRIEDEMLRELDPESVDVLRSMLRSCAHSLEATRPRAL